MGVIWLLNNLKVVKTNAYQTTAQNQLKKWHTIGRFLNSTDYNNSITNKDFYELWTIINSTQRYVNRIC